MYKFRTLAIFGQLTKSKAYRIIYMNIKCLSSISHETLYDWLNLNQTRAHGSNDHKNTVAYEMRKNTLNGFIHLMLS